MALPAFPRVQPGIMKTRRIASLLAAVAVAVVPVMAAESEPVPVELEVAVVLPASVDPWHSDDIEHTFARYVRDRFERAGHTGRVVRVEDRDPRAPGVPRLTLNLVEWRRSRTGNVDCTVAGEFASDAGERRLGLASSTELLWGSVRTRWDLERAFERAGEDVVDRVYRRLRTEGLVADPKAVSVGPAARDVEVKPAGVRI